MARPLPSFCPTSGWWLGLESQGFTVRGGGTRHLGIAVETRPQDRIRRVEVHVEASISAGPGECNLPPPPPLRLLILPGLAAARCSLASSLQLSVHGHSHMIRPFLAPPLGYLLGVDGEILGQTASPHLTSRQATTGPPSRG